MNINIKKSIVKLLSGNIFVTVTNLGRDITVAAVFGSSHLVDIFFLFISIPVFIITIATNAMRNVCVPILTEAEQGQGEDTYEVLSRRLVAYTNKLGLSLLIGSFLVISIFYFYHAKIVQLAEVPTAVWIVLSILPMYSLAFIIEASQGILQVKEIYFIPVIARLGLPLGIIIGAYFFSTQISIYALGIGGFVGALLGCLVLMGIYYRVNILNARWIPKLPPMTAQKFKKNLGVLIAGGSITYLNPVVDQWMSSFCGEGAVAYIGYASRLTVGIASIIIGSVSPVVLGYYSRAIVADEQHKVQSVFNLSFTAFTWVGSFMTLSCWYFSRIVIDILYGHGRFASADVDVVAELMNFYAAQFPFLFASTATFTLISAVSKNEWFIRFGLIMLVVNIVANGLLVLYFGIYGIACSTVIVYAVSLALMCHSLHKAGFVKISLKHLLEGLLVLVILILIGVSLYYLEYWQLSHFDSLWDPKIVDPKMLCAVLIWLIFGAVTLYRVKNTLFLKT